MQDPPSPRHERCCELAARLAQPPGVCCEVAAPPARPRDAPCSAAPPPGRAPGGFRDLAAPIGRPPARPHAFAARSGRARARLRNVATPTVRENLPLSHSCGPFRAAALPPSHLRGTLRDGPRVASRLRRAGLGAPSARPCVGDPPLRVSTMGLAPRRHGPASPRGPFAPVSAIPARRLALDIAPCASSRWDSRDPRCHTSGAPRSTSSRPATTTRSSGAARSSRWLGGAISLVQVLPRALGALPGSGLPRHRHAAPMAGRDRFRVASLDLGGARGAVDYISR